MKRIFLVVLIACVTGGCDGGPPPPGEGPGDTAVAPPMAAPTEDNIGDLEQMVLLEAAVAEQSRGPNIETTPLVDATGRMNYLTIDVSPPFPDELWLDIRVRARRSFPRNPGVLRIAIRDGDEVLDTFGTVVGRTSTPSVPEHSVNVLAARETIPETMLIALDVEALLMPEGTDPDTVDPMTAEVPESRFSRALPTPPVRINFEGAPAAPEETAEAEAAQTGEGP